MRRWAIAVAALLLPAAPAFSCPPSLPGDVDPLPPTLDQVAERIARRAVIAYGQVISVRAGDHQARFRVLHVYRGTLAPGTILTVANAWGDNAPPCSGMAPPPPQSKGDYGIISYDFADRPELNWLDEKVRDRLFARGLIQRATLARPR